MMWSTGKGDQTEQAIDWQSSGRCAESSVDELVWTRQIMVCQNIEMDQIEWGELLAEARMMGRIEVDELVLRRQKMVCQN